VARRHQESFARAQANRAALSGGVPLVDVAPASPGTAKHFLNALGTVAPLNSVLVRSRIDGQIVKIFFHEGQFIEQGALLAQVDPRPGQVLLTEANGQMAHDQAMLAQAEMDLQRYEPLAKRQAIPQQQRDQQVALVDQLRGAVQSDSGQVDNAKLQLTYSRITAPISGRIGLRIVDPGNIVHANDSTGIVTITQVRSITAVFNLAEDDLPVLQRALQKDPYLTVEAWDRANQVRLASGHILSLDNSIDAASGTLKVKAIFANDHGELFPNEFVNVRIQIDAGQNALLVPESAVRRNGDTEYVYLLSGDHTVHVHPVQTRQSGEGKAEIVSGLKPGEMVVTGGFDKLQDSIRVAIADSQ
jgi:multidrug efflux system membrane fusion protein